MFVQCEMGCLNTSLVNKWTKAFKKFSFVTDRFLLSSDSSCRLAALVGKTWKACCICVYTLNTDFLPLGKGLDQLPQFSLQYTDQSEEPTLPGVDDICVTVGHRGQQTLLFCPPPPLVYFFTPSQRLFLLFLLGYFHQLALLMM